MAKPVARIFDGPVEVWRNGVRLGVMEIWSGRLMTDADHDRFVVSRGRACGECCHWLMGRHENGDPTGAGECRRRSPGMDWPNTRANDFCGEYEWKNADVEADG